MQLPSPDSTPSLGRLGASILAPSALVCIVTNALNWLVRLLSSKRPLLPVGVMAACMIASSDTLPKPNLDNFTPPMQTSLLCLIARLAKLDINILHRLPSWITHVGIGTVGILHVGIAPVGIGTCTHGNYDYVISVG